jgi:transposase
MDFKKGKNRNSPLEVKSLESLIKANNSIRLIDGFVDSLDLKALGFQINHAGQGRPPYHPSILLKLYIYGYLNGVRSSRKLEESTKLNLKVMWLLGSLSPDHSTISTFRKDHEEEIKAVFKESVSIAIHFNLIGKKLLAGDGTKLRAQNSKKNNYNQKKLDRHLKYIDNKVSVYMEELSRGDGNKEVLKKKIKLQEVRKEKYKIIKKHLEESGESQVSLSDPDARLLVTSQKAEVGYNIQSV